MNVTDQDPTDLLARDYRRLLRWYPKTWRDAHGDALLGVLMDDADAADRFTVQRGEWCSFAAAGRVARLDRVILRGVRDATSTIMVALGLGTFLVLFVASSWAPWAVEPRSVGPFYDAGPILTVLWLVAFIAAGVGQW